MSIAARTSALIGTQPPASCSPEGNVITAPSFKGMSGAGVWRLGSAANAGARDQLAAIFTGHDDKAEIARATRVAAHVALIRAYHPELAAALPCSVTWPVRVRPGEGTPR